MARIALIGTAGRNPEYPLSRGLWEAMVDDVFAWVDAGDTLVSGGAAWADHLAVRAYLDGKCCALELYLPAPLEHGRFAGPFKSAGATANYYHGKFSRVLGEDTLAQIVEAISKGAKVQHEPVGYGAGAMFARNRKVASAAQAVVAYTFGEGDQPADGGTLNTWRMVAGDDKTHVALAHLVPESRVRDDMRFPANT